MPPLHTLNQNGRSVHRKRLILKITVWAGVLLAAYQMLWTYWLAGMNIPDVEIDKVTGQQRIRRRPDKLIKRHKTTGEQLSTEPFDGIMEGYLTLININIQKQRMQSDGEKRYSGVMGTFCHISWNLQAEDPTKVPMFKDLRDASPLCSGTLYSVDLYEITRQAESYDFRNYTFAATPPKRGQGPIRPTAVIFHETRCGSTLVANLFAAFAPEHTRVFTEAPPPIQALEACDYGNCDRQAHVQLVRDVFYMMGRVTREAKPQYAFYKIHSVGAWHLDVFGEAMPQTPWLYIYRDSVEIMMSHFKNYQQGNPLSQDFQPPCLKNYGESSQPPLLTQLVEAKSRTVASLNPEEYCAAHLASLSAAALRQHEQASTAKYWFVNYAELPYKIWESVLPELIGRVTPSYIANMQRISHYYSKGRGPRAGQKWHEDSTLKQGTAPDSIKNAVRLFLDSIYQRMESIH